MPDTLENLVYRFESDAFPQTEMHVVGARVTEGLNEPYSAQVDLRVLEEDADLGAFLGKNAVLLLERASTARRFCGVIVTVRPRGDDTEAPAVSLDVVPALNMLSLRRNTRMFQEMSAPDILTAVLEEGLGPYGRSLSLELSGSYPTRECCLQYQETDLDFVHRLMEEEGISYAFDHEGEAEVMVLRDDNTAFAKVKTAAGEGALVLTGPNMHAGEQEGIVSFSRAYRSTTTSVTARDFDWTLSGYAVSDAETGTDERGRDRESYEHGLGRELRIWSYDPGPRRYQKADAAAQKVVRLQAHVAGAITGHGIARVTALAPGVTFELSGHPSADLDGEYLVTRVLHVSQPPSLGQGDGQDDVESYHNRFECIPLDVPYRPKRRTAKPVIPSIQTAVVTGPAGEEIHVDEHGRIKVRFHWDRENPADETSSCWVRVQQAWAGGGWGFWWVPRIGMEVVVQFIDGDPDRPLVTGSVYDGTNGLPYPLPDEKTKSTIKSNSSIGGGGSNEFRFEDKAGSEEIYTHAQKDYNEVVENDHNTLVHNNQTNTVDVDQTQEIGANQTETVHGNQEMTVDGNRTVHVKSNFDETIDGTETRHVVGAVSESFDANEDRTVSGSVTETIGASETRTIGAAQSWTIGGSQTLTVSGDSTETIGGAFTETVSGGINVVTPADIAISAAGGWNVTAAAGITFVATAGMRVLVPGGNRRSDNFHKWIATWEKGYGGYKLEAWIFTSEIVGIETGFTNYKYEDTGVFIDKGFKLWKTITKNRFTGVVGKFGGPEVDPAQRTHT